MPAMASRKAVVIGLLMQLVGAKVCYSQEMGSVYPTRPITIVVAFAAGGGTDTVARQIADELRSVLKQQVLIENRTGGGGVIAWNAVSDAQPDGYTLLLAENALPINSALAIPERPFNPIERLQPIAGVGRQPLVFVVNKSIREASIEDLARQSRRTATMSYSSPGIGTLVHLAFEAISDRANLQAAHVPYRGGEPALRDVASGHVGMTLAAASVVTGLIEDGQVRALAVTGDKRSALLSNIPTLKEAGLDIQDVDLTLWYGLFGPKALASSVKQTISMAIAAVIDRPEFRQRMEKLDIHPQYSTGVELEKKLVAEIDGWSQFIAARGVKIAQ